MSETDFPEIMPTDWDGMPVGLRISLSPLDDFGIPFDKRGLTTKIPSDPAKFEQFADSVSATVRATVLHVLRSRTGFEL